MKRKLVQKMHEGIKDNAMQKKQGETQWVGEKEEMVGEAVP